MLEYDAVGGDLLSRLIRVVPLAVWFWPSILAMESVVGNIDFYIFFAKIKSFQELYTRVPRCIEVIFFGEHLLVEKKESVWSLTLSRSQRYVCQCGPEQG